MTKLNRLTVAYAFVFISALAFEQAHAADSTNKPNVLFIAVDDLNDWVGCLGGHPQAKTPNIDALAKKGVLFEQAHCAAPLCSPSRTSIMMGLRPSTTGIYGNLNWFRDMPQYADWVTLPQYFRKHGYLAWGGGKLYHQAHGKFSDASAWDHVYSTRMGTVPPPKNERYKHGLRPKFESNPILARLIDWGPTDAPIEANPDWKTADGAAEFLGRYHDKPFFLGCGIYLPHLPWYAPKKFFDMHPLEDIELPPYKADDFDDIPAIGRRMGERHTKHIRESGKWKEAVQGCLAADSFADACVGHVLDALEQSRYRDNTIVVLWGDHGYDVGEKKIAKSALWEQTTRTPLIVYAPDVSKTAKTFDDQSTHPVAKFVKTFGEQPATRPKVFTTFATNDQLNICKSPVSLVDLYPTLLDLCGLPENKQLDGRSFARLVKEPNADWPYPAIITHSPHWLGANHAVRSREFHYIHYSDGGEELYDVKADPLQRKNLAADPAHASAKAELKKWLPKKNAPHFRGDKSASSESGQEPVKKRKQVGRIKRSAAPASRNPRDIEDAGSSSVRSSARPTTASSETRQKFRPPLDALIKTSCIDCHDADTETRLDFTKLAKDFENADAFRQWVKIYDRVKAGEMPPPEATQPDRAVRDKALSLLKGELKQANQRLQKTVGRVPSRRLSRLEYEHTLHDLLGIGGQIAKLLPPENKSGAFDVVAAKQDMSNVHVKGFLAAADAALDEAIQIGPKPPMSRELDYPNSRYMKMWFERPVRMGGGTLFRDKDDLIIFRGENYNLRSDTNGLRFPVAGRYRITVTGSAYQPRSSVTMSLKRQNDIQGDSELFAAWDVDEKLRTVSTINYLRPDDYFYVSADELEPAPNGKVIYNSQPASEFKGEGVRIRKVLVEGPLEDVWPPQRTRDLFPGVEWELAENRRYYKAVTTKSHYEHIRDAVAALAPRAFQRSVTDEEIEALTRLAVPTLKARRGFIASARVPLRAILVSPETLFLTNETIGSDFRYGESTLTQNALAARLSYFLSRSLPDEGLLQLASDGKLSDKTLDAQVTRMLADRRSDRFINEFLDQWLDLEQIDATTPDRYLYPEYDDVLRRAMLAETRVFFRHLIDEDLNIANLIDSDFTFLNRKLAEHYGIPNIQGEEMRKVNLPTDSVRGGILTHASIAKVTANGTVTTPVKRGNFVLTNLLGQAPNPPPPGVGSIEPDTRGATTIRETLAKHQSMETCAVCHRRIDPPGFALESFDPVGNFRKRYRLSKGVKRTAVTGLRFLHKDYNPGQRVDCSGQTEDGFAFRDIREYKRHLMKSKEQVARNLVSQLITFATGAEIQFADREDVEAILKRNEDKGYPLKQLIHEVVRSRMFRCR